LTRRARRDAVVRVSVAKGRTLLDCEIGVGERVGGGGGCDGETADVRVVDRVVVCDEGEVLIEVLVGPKVGVWS
jgi:hypothetical protein